MQEDDDASFSSTSSHKRKLTINDYLHEELKFHAERGKKEGTNGERKFAAKREGNRCHIITGKSNFRKKGERIIYKKMSDLYLFIFILINNHTSVPVSYFFSFY